MGSLKLINNIINQLGTPAFNSNTIAERPAAGYVGRIFISTDTFVIQRDNGTTWDNIGGGGGGITGSGAAGQVTFWTGASAVSGDNGLFWDNTNKRLGINTTTPGVRLDIHGAGVIGQLNGTGTNNAYLDFQNAGTTQWRVGNGYNVAANDWQLIRVPTSANALTIKSNGTFIFNSNNTNVLFSDNFGDWETYKVRNGFSFIQYVYNYNNSITRTSGLWYNTTKSTAIGSYAATQSGDGLFYLSAYGSTNTGFTDGGYMQFIQSAAIGTYATTNFTLGLSTAGTPAYLNDQLLISAASGFARFTQRLNVNNATDNALFELNVNGNTYTGGLSPTILTVSGNTTMARTATGYYCTATLTLTLPSAASINNVYWVIAASGVTVTVNRAGTDDILNLAGTSVTSITITSNQRAMFYVGGGTRTFLISQA